MGDDRDWTWLSRSRAAIGPQVPTERVLWSVRKDSRAAVLAVRLHPLGTEVRCAVNGSLLWSQVVRDGASVGAISDEHLQAWIAKGWLLDDEPPRA